MRTKIIETSFCLFYQQGFHATGVEQLSQAAGITKRTLYHHFEGKDHLIESVLRYRDEQFLLQVQTFVESRAVEDRPLAYIEYVMQWTQSTDFCGCLFLHAAGEYTDPNSCPHHLATTHKQKIRQMVENWCQAAAIDNPLITAQQLFVIGEGIISSQQIGGGDFSLLTTSYSLAKSIIQNVRRPSE